MGSATSKRATAATVKKNLSSTTTHLTTPRRSKRARKLTAGSQPAAASSSSEEDDETRARRLDEELSDDQSDLWTPPKKNKEQRWSSSPSSSSSNNSDDDEEEEVTVLDVHVPVKHQRNAEAATFLEKKRAEAKKIMGAQNNNKKEASKVSQNTTHTRAMRPTCPFSLSQIADETTPSASSILPDHEEKDETLLEEALPSLEADAKVTEETTGQ